MDLVRQPQVRVHVDRAGQHEHPAGVDHFRGVAQIGGDTLDAAIADCDIGEGRAGRRDDASAGDDEIAGHKIKAGDKVVILAYVLHHSPKYWDEPEKFDPERFAPERAKKRVKYTYLPFAAGKRACIGGALSQIENTLALLQLLRRFTPDYAGPKPAKIHATVTLCPKGGLPFRIHALS